MKRLEIDFARSETPGRLPAYILAAMLMFAGVAAAVLYLHILQETRLLVSQAGASSERAKPNQSASSATTARDEETEKTRLKAAQNVVAKLATPWPQLFQALEAASSADASLLRIEPDAGRREIHISAESANFASAVKYAGSLETTGVLLQVYIVSQRKTANNALRPIQVEIAGRWQDATPNRAVPAPEILSPQERPRGAGT